MSSASAYGSFLSLLKLPGCFRRYTIWFKFVLWVVLMLADFNRIVAELMNLEFFVKKNFFFLFIRDRRLG